MSEGKLEAQRDAADARARGYPYAHAFDDKRLGTWRVVYGEYYGEPVSKAERVTSDKYINASLNTINEVEDNQRYWEAEGRKEKEKEQESKRGKEKPIEFVPKSTPKSAQEKLAEIQLKEVEKRRNLEPSVQTIRIPIINKKLPVKVSKETAAIIADKEQRRLKDAQYTMDSLLRKYGLTGQESPEQIKDIIIYNTEKKQNEIRENAAIKAKTDENNAKELYMKQIAELDSKYSKGLINKENYEKEKINELNLFNVTKDQISRDIDKAQEEANKVTNDYNTWLKYDQIIREEGKIGNLKRAAIVIPKHMEKGIANIGQLGANVMNKLGTPVVQEIANLKPTAYSKDINPSAGLENRAEQERSNRLMMIHKEDYTGEIGTARPAIRTSRAQIQTAVAQNVPDVPVVSTVASPTKGFAEVEQKEQESPERGMDLTKLIDTRYGTHL